MVIFNVSILFISNSNTMISKCFLFNFIFIIILLNVSVFHDDLLLQDVKEGTTTGVSAKDRAKTILALASPNSKADDFNRPGHIFPLKYREGGVLKRSGHTEASVDLAILAGLPPVAVLCEIVDNDDGSMARLPKLREFAKQENLKIISIADLIRYHLENLMHQSSIRCLKVF